MATVLVGTHVRRGGPKALEDPSAPAAGRCVYPGLQGRAPSLQGEASTDCQSERREGTSSEDEDDNHPEHPLVGAQEQPRT